METKILQELMCKNIYFYLGYPTEFASLNMGYLVLGRAGLVVLPVRLLSWNCWLWLPVAPSSLIPLLSLLWDESTPHTPHVWPHTFQEFVTFCARARGLDLPPGHPLLLLVQLRTLSAHAHVHCPAPNPRSHCCLPRCFIPCP